QTISAAEAGAAIAESAGDDVASLLGELLAQTLTFGVVERLGYNPELAGEAQALAKQVREARSTPAVSELADRLKRFWIALEIRGDDQRDVQQGLVRLLHLLANNIVELVADDSWLSGQMRSIEALASGPIDRDALSHLESTMRETIFKQSTIKKSLDDAKDTLKTMVTMFIDRLGTMAENTGDYHDRMSGYATKIER